MRITQQLLRQIIKEEIANVTQARAPKPPVEKPPFDGFAIFKGRVEEELAKLVPNAVKKMHLKSHVGLLKALNFNDSALQFMFKRGDYARDVAIECKKVMYEEGWD